MCILLKNKIFLFFPNTNSNSMKLRIRQSANHSYFKWSCGTIIWLVFIPCLPCAMHYAGDRENVSEQKHIPISHWTYSLVREIDVNHKIIWTSTHGFDSVLLEKCNEGTRARLKSRKSFPEKVKFKETWALNRIFS